MKTLMSLMITLMISLSLTAQNVSSNYFTNSNEAKAYAALNDTQILMVFGGSDWCRPCIKFKKEILDASNFQSYTKGKLAILYLDFPSKKKNKLSKEATQHNEALAAQYNMSGSFPKILLMDKEMTKIKEIPYGGESTSEFITLL